MAAKFAYSERQPQFFNAAEWLTARYRLRPLRQINALHVSRPLPVWLFHQYQAKHAEHLPARSSLAKEPNADGLFKLTSAIPGQPRLWRAA